MDFNQIEHLIEVHQITDIYLMAALLSATAEKNPAFAWDLNMNSLFHVLNLAKAKKIKKYFGRRALLFSDQQPHEKTPHNTPLWSPRQFTELANKLEKDGANITIIFLVLMCEVCAIPA